MKKLDLNLEVGEKHLGAEKDKVKIVINWILGALSRSINKPDTKGNPTSLSNIDVQRRYAKITHLLNAQKDGVIEMDDDDFSFLHKKFHQAEFPVGSDVSVLLADISKRLDEVKNG